MADSARFSRLIWVEVTFSPDILPMRLHELMCNATGKRSFFRYACSFTFYGVTVWTHESDRLPYVFEAMYEEDDSGEWRDDELRETWRQESTWTTAL